GNDLGIGISGLACGLWRIRVEKINGAQQDARSETANQVRGRRIYFRRMASAAERGSPVSCFFSSGFFGAPRPVPLLGTPKPVEPSEEWSGEIGSGGPSSVESNMAPISSS